MSSGSEAASPRPAKTTPGKQPETLGWLPPPPKSRQPSPRDSSASMLSTDSYNPSEIGEAIQLSVVDEQRGAAGPVKHTYVRGLSPQSAAALDACMAPDQAEDSDSLASSGTMPLGRLDTIRSSTNPRNPPAISVSTAIQEVVPPRLRRRPVSEIIVSLGPLESAQRGLRHRRSLDISDNLLRLMESASDLTYGAGTDLTGAVARAPSSLTMSISKESFQTAEELSLGGSPERAVEDRQLPRRPDARAMSRARQVSASQAQERAGARGRALFGETGSMSSGSDRVSSGTWPAAAGLAEDVGLFENRPYLGKSMDSRPVQLDAETPSLPVPRPPSLVSSCYPSVDRLHSRSSAVLGKSLGSGSSRHSWTQLDASTGEHLRVDRMRRPVMTGRNDTAATFSDLTVDLKQVGSGVVASCPDSRKSLVSLPSQNLALPREERPASSTAAGSEEKTGSGSGLACDPGDTSPGLENPDLGLVKRSTGLETPGSGAVEPDSAMGKPESAMGKPDSVSENPPTFPEEDDGFYDIEEPVVVPFPTRAKSVKDHTKLPQRRNTRRRSRRLRNKDPAPGLQVKPFSYDTLVHLLESMNGTVVGEEFRQLNLPIQEQQLIEKVIDLLSRLTLDMVTDKNRFDVGIERLEKAHRQDSPRVTRADKNTEMGHKTTEIDHKTTEIDHKTTEIDHKTTEMDHKTTEIDHKTTEMDHKMGAYHHHQGSPSGRDISADARIVVGSEREDQSEPDWYSFSKRSVNEYAVDGAPSVGIFNAGHSQKSGRVQNNTETRTSKTNTQKNNIGTVPKNQHWHNADAAVVPATISSQKRRDYFVSKAPRHALPRLTFPRKSCAPPQDMPAVNRDTVAFLTGSTRVHAGRTARRSFALYLHHIPGFKRDGMRPFHTN
ncbi:hypothetical protein METBIDRAFT_9167 [Metschnikowia bicuspidata var. bicuspidata NRRL YB-4993]|uniref:Uncharacterized protein n=1 Tax=Metschnikowia bicuspidata var. bicuspidata NRRL YB-4993 TaxID=869754 RepID=A0A1A0HFN8_9ASCO|nr:hypothetical protein METBIDRAFT_9167 [Metschnikowia bicuspidata var. bicuspidata NRRL YB-4993]OBA22816.1 hypothetical protein METBIDRAFT_9167 [Metschnikowia bicuspidata var. bicuspidata NRRL YB-4993]